MVRPIASPKVSVVVPAYNAAEFLRETLEHALAQTYKNVEIIVVNDGSRDTTADIAQSFGDPVRLVSTENRGVAKARNTGIEEATGEFLAFLDADDLWEPEKLALQVDAIDDDHRFVYTDSVTFGAENLANFNMSSNASLPSGDIRKALVQRNFVATSSVLVDRQIALDIGGFNPDIPVCDDWDFWLRALALTRARSIEQPLLRYRVHPNSLGSNTEKRIRGSRMVIDSALDALDIPEREKKVIRREAISECYGYAATLARSESRTMFATRLYMTAFAYAPEWSLVKEIVKTLIGPALLRRIKPEYSL